jgi:hypothetical protein
VGDPLDPRQQLEPQQVGEREPHQGLAMAICVLAVDGGVGRA